MLEKSMNFLESSAIDCSSLYLLNDIPMQKAINAVFAYGNNNDKPESIFVLFDSTVFGSAKKGFYINPLHFCSCDEDNNKRNFHILDIDSFDYEKSVLMNYLIVNFMNKSEKSVKIQLNCYENKFLEPSKFFLNKLLKFLKEDLIDAAEEIRLKEIEEEENKKIEAQKIEEINKIKMIEIEKKERQKSINDVFEPTDDEILNRTNGLFISLNEIHSCLQSTILLLTQLQLKLNLTDIDYDNFDICETLEEILKNMDLFDEFKTEYGKMITVSEIIQNNRDIIIQRLNIIKNEIENYERAIKIVNSFFCNIFGFEISTLKDNKENAYSVMRNFMNEVVVVTEFKKEHFNEEAEEEYDEYKGEDNSSILSSFLDTNLDAILDKLKNAGVILSVSALQNDANIIKIANIIYNFLPTPIRFIVGIDVVENFLLENREWLINKLK